MPKGRPFQPGNQYGRGRPPGSRNKKTVRAQELLDSHADAVIRKGLFLALKGDAAMLRFFLPYIVSRRADLPLKTGPLPAGTTAELDQSSEKLIKQVAAGRISLSDAAGIADLLEGRRRIIETGDHERRIGVTEQRLDEQQGRAADHQTLSYEEKIQ
jgi:hypothetical protein